MWEQAGRRDDAAEFPPIGQMIEVDGYLMHLHCSGSGSPTVLLESPLDTWGAEVWTKVQPDLSSTTRVCSYDKPGIRWSEHRPEPRDAAHIVEELHSLLQAAGEPAPYVMVGFSFGGLLTRLFDDHFPGEVAGLVFVESSHPEQEVRVPPPPGWVRLKSRLSRRLKAATGFNRLTSDLSVNAGAAYSNQSLSAALSYWALHETAFQQSVEPGVLGSRPVIVLTAGGQERHPEVQDAWLEMQGDLAKLSSNSDHRIIPDSRHSIPIDDPGAVIVAVGDLVTAVRTDSEVRKSGSTPNPPGSGSSIAP